MYAGKFPIFYSYFSTFYSCFLKVLKEKKWIWSRLKLFLGYRCRSYHPQKSTDMMTSSVQMLPWSPMSSGNLNCMDPGPLGIWTTFCQIQKANLVVSTWNLEEGMLVVVAWESSSKFFQVFEPLDGIELQIFRPEMTMYHRY